MKRLFTRPVRFLIAALLSLGFCACSKLEGEGQFTNKVAAPSFVSQLYGDVTQTVTISHDAASHVSWLGFIQSNDYKYFKITKVQAGDETVVADGVEIGGETYTANSSAIVRDVSIGSGSSGSNEFVDGSINVAGAGEGDLKITVKYSPIKAIESEDDPHEAYLIVYYDEPEPGALRVKLNGYTDGMKDEKCARAVSTMTPVVYAFKGGSFDFYFCGEEVQVTGQNNIASLAPDDPGYHGQSTNLTPIPAVDAEGNEQFLTFYQVDEETLCLLSADLSDGEPSIPDFTFVIPEGLAPIDSLDIGMAEGSFAECSLDAAGAILCDGNILIDTGVVPVSPSTVTNGSFTTEELTTSQCTDFGTLTGSGAFGDTELTLVMKGTMLSDANTQAYNIVDALVTSVIELECVSGCE